MRLIAFVIICLIATSWLVEGQFPNNNNNNNNNNNSSDPELFLAIIVVVVIIAIVLVGAIASLVIICFVYYCCTPIPIPPEHPPTQVRANPNPQAPTSPYMTETLPPGYDDHEQYPRGTLSQRSRNSLPRYSLIFKKNRNRRASERSQGSIDPGIMSIPDNVELSEDRGDDAV